jgi:hypothetical protein
LGWAERLGPAHEPKVGPPVELSPLTSLSEPREPLLSARLQIVPAWRVPVAGKNTFSGEPPRKRNYLFPRAKPASSRFLLQTQNTESCRRLPINRYERAFKLVVHRLNKVHGRCLATLNAPASPSGNHSGWTPPTGGPCAAASSRAPRIRGHSVCYVRPDDEGTSSMRSKIVGRASSKLRRARKKVFRLRNSNFMGVRDAAAELQLRCLRSDSSFFNAAHEPRRHRLRKSGASGGKGRNGMPPVNWPGPKSMTPGRCLQAVPAYCPRWDRPHRDI